MPLTRSMVFELADFRTHPHLINVIVGRPDPRISASDGISVRYHIDAPFLVFRLA